MENSILNVFWKDYGLKKQKMRFTKIYIFSFLMVYPSFFDDEDILEGRIDAVFCALYDG